MKFLQQSVNGETMRNVLILGLATATIAAVAGYAPPADPVPLPRPRPNFEHAFSAFDGKPMIVIEQPSRLPAWADGSFGYYGPVFAAPVVAKGR